MCVLCIFKSKHILKCPANEKQFLPAQPKHFLTEDLWSARAPFPHPDFCEGLRKEPKAILTPNQSWSHGNPDPKAILTPRRSWPQSNLHLSDPRRCWVWDNHPESVSGADPFVLPWSFFSSWPNVLYLSLSWAVDVSPCLWWSLGMQLRSFLTLSSSWLPSQHFPAHFCLFSSLPLFIFIPAKRFYALPLQALPGALSVPAGVSGTLTTGDI